MNSNRYSVKLKRLIGEAVERDTFQQPSILWATTMDDPSSHFVEVKKRLDVRCERRRKSGVGCGSGKAGGEKQEKRKWSTENGERGMRTEGGSAAAVREACHLEE